MISLILSVVLITFVATKVNSKEIKNMKNVYIGKLANSDSSIQNAMKYLELTNGIKQQLNGEKK